MSDHDPRDGIISALAARSVALYAIGHEAEAAALLEHGCESHHDGLLAVVWLGARLTASAATPWAVPIEEEDVRAMPLVSQLLQLIDGDHHGGLHQLWSQVCPHNGAAARRALLALAGTAARRPELN